MKYFLFLFAIATAVCSILHTDDANAQDHPQHQALMPKDQISVFKKYCYDCHDASANEGGVNLEDLSLNISQDIQTAETWQKVLDALNTKEMPPEDEKQVPAKQKTAFLDALSNQMVTARRILSDSGGTITLRRLNRREYANTLESLLGVQPDVTSLPDDQATSGFDTAGASLFFSSDQLEQYLAAARGAIELALSSAKLKDVSTKRFEPEEAATQQYSDLAKEYQDKYDRATAWKAYQQEHGLVPKKKNGKKNGGKKKAGIKQEADNNVTRKNGLKTPADFGFLDEYEARKIHDSSQNWLPQLVDYLKRPETKTGVRMILTIKQVGMARIKLGRISNQEGGNYVVRIRAGAYPDAMTRMNYLELTQKMDGASGSTRLGWRKVNGTVDRPEEIEFSFAHPPGKRAQYFIHQRTHQDRGDKNLWEAHRKENGIGTLPGTWIDWAELEGPFPAAGHGKAIEEVFFSKPKKWDEKRYAKEVIKRFTARAFRSTEPSDEFLEKLLAIYDDERTRTKTAQQALISPLSIVLSSPSFLYMVEAGGKRDGGTGGRSERETGGKRDSRTAGSSPSPTSPRPSIPLSPTPSIPLSPTPSVPASQLSPSETAVRLSYFLWSEPPDEKLMSLAKQDRLLEPDVLREQTERLLADERADRFVEGFVHQWLEMERLEMFEFRGTMYPNFDNATRESAREEIYETIKLLIKEELPVRNLLYSDFVVVNDVLADYYGLPAPKKDGHEFRKVNVPKGSPRGGLLGTAAVLAMGSDGLRSSPVERGAWVLRHLLNDPPPPAPPNVPQLARLDGEVLGARDLQRLHQEEPQCAQCHRKIDPIGYGLEQFNAAGEWRDKEQVYIDFRKGFKEFPINSNGTLPGGEKFAGYFELRNAVAKHQHDFARGFAESLMSYALGRPYGLTDQDVVDEMLRSVGGGKGSPNDFIHEIVQSKTFQSRSGGRVALSNDLRTWTDTKGRSIDASLLSIEKNAAVIRREDGRVFKILIETLSDEDQTYLRQKE